jgi:hypothetical protein
MQGVARGSIPPPSWVNPQIAIDPDGHEQNLIHCAVGFLAVVVDGNVVFGFDVECAVG